MASAATLARRELGYLREHAAAMKRRDRLEAKRTRQLAFETNKKILKALEAQDANPAAGSGAEAEAGPQTHEP